MAALMPWVELVDKVKDNAELVLFARPTCGWGPPGTNRGGAPAPHAASTIQRFVF